MWVRQQVWSHLQVELVGPGADDPVLSRGSVGDLVLEDVVPPRSISVLVENYRSAGASWPQTAGRKAL